MTDILQRAHQVVKGVTIGPWKFEDRGDEITVGAGTYLEHTGSYAATDEILTTDVFGIDDNDPDRNQRVRDARFIAAARTLVPRLATEVQRLRESAAVEGSRAGAGKRPVTETEMCADQHIIGIIASCLHDSLAVEDAAYILSTLHADPKVAVVALPEEMPAEYLPAGMSSALKDQPVWESGGAWASFIPNTKEITFMADGQNVYGDISSPTVARNLARVLLAAADKLEQSASIAGSDSQ